MIARTESALVALVLLLVLHACAPFGRGGAGEVALDPALQLAIPDGSALRISGRLSGPFSSLGPQMRIEALLAADGRLRADMYYELEGIPQEDVLLWGEDHALRFDRTHGGVQDLGSEPGGFAVAGEEFRVPHLVWLALGRWPASAPLASWTNGSPRWEGRYAGVELAGRVPDRATQPVQSELRWSADDEERRLTATVERFEDTELGRLPTWLELGGFGMRGRARLEWELELVEIDEVAHFDPFRSL